MALRDGALTVVEKPLKNFRQSWNTLLKGSFLHKLQNAVILILFTCCLSSCDDEEYRKEISSFQFELNKEFADEKTSPLPEENRLTFHKLPFFKADKKYRVEAELKLTPDETPFEMPTTTDRKPVYRKYARAFFELEGKDLQLDLFQNLELIKEPGYENYLFLPYGDLTNGDETYGGGRFIDLRIPQNNTIIIDFNKSYNPLCAYNHKYSCPIPPAQNRLDVKVKAGVKAPRENHD